MYGSHSLATAAARLRDKMTRAEREPVRKKAKREQVTGGEGAVEARAKASNTSSASSRAGSPTDTNDASLTVGGNGEDSSTQTEQGVPLIACGEDQTVGGNGDSGTQTENGGPLIHRRDHQEGGQLGKTGDERSASEASECHSGVSVEEQQAAVEIPEGHSDKDAVAEGDLNAATQDTTGNNGNQSQCQNGVAVPSAPRDDVEMGDAGVGTGDAGAQTQGQMGNAAPSADPDDVEMGDSEPSNLHSDAFVLTKDNFHMMTQPHWARDNNIPLTRAMIEQYIASDPALKVQSDEDRAQIKLLMVQPRVVNPRKQTRIYHSLNFFEGRCLRCFETWDHHWSNCRGLCQWCQKKTGSLAHFGEPCRTKSSVKEMFEGKNPQPFSEQELAEIKKTLPKVSDTSRPAKRPRVQEDDQRSEAITIARGTNVRRGTGAPRQDGASGYNDEMNFFNDEHQRNYEHMFRGGQFARYEGVMRQAAMDAMYDAVRSQFVRDLHENGNDQGIRRSHDESDAQSEQANRYGGQQPRDIRQPRGRSDAPANAPTGPRNQLRNDAPANAPTGPRSQSHNDRGRGNGRGGRWNGGGGRWNRGGAGHRR